MSFASAIRKSLPTAMAEINSKRNLVACSAVGEHGDALDRERQEAAAAHSLLSPRAVTRRHLTAQSDRAKPRQRPAERRPAGSAPKNASRNVSRIVSKMAKTAATSASPSRGFRAGRRNRRRRADAAFGQSAPAGGPLIMGVLNVTPELLFRRRTISRAGGRHRARAAPRRRGRRHHRYRRGIDPALWRHAPGLGRRRARAARADPAGCRHASASRFRSTR